MEKYNEYKDSGVQWLGEIPSHWGLCSVRSYVQEYVEKNKPEKTRELLALSYALGVTLYRDKQYNMDRVKDNYEEYKIVHKDVLVVSPNDIIKGSAYVSRYYGCISPMYLTLKSRFEDSTYLLYLSLLLRTKQAGRTFFSLAKGLIGSILDNGKYVTRRMSVSRYDLLAFKVVMPPLSEQKSIVSYLDDKCGKIDKLLENKAKELELLAEMKQRVIADAVTKGLNHDATMKDSGIPWLPQIPEHWDVQRAKNLYKKEQRPVQDGDDIVTCFRDGQVTLRKNRRTTGFTEATNFTGYQHICMGDLVIHQMDAFAGSSGVSDSDGMGTPVLSVCTAKTPLVDNYYYAHVLRLMGKNGFILSLYRGIRERSSDFRFDTFARQWLPVPPLNEQKAIVAHIEEKVSKIDALAEKLQKEIERINEYKQRLISDIVTGQIKVI